MQFCKIENGRNCAKEVKYMQNELKENISSYGTLEIIWVVV